MKLFAAAPLGQDERVFNHRLSRARRCVENALGILANRLGCLLTTLRQEAKNVEIMVNAYITLHNMLRTAGADDAGCWSWHTQQSALLGIYLHVLVSKGKRR